MRSEKAPSDGFRSKASSPRRDGPGCTPPASRASATNRSRPATEGSERSGFIYCNKHRWGDRCHEFPRAYGPSSITWPSMDPSHNFDIRRRQVNEPHSATTIAASRYRSRRTRRLARSRRADSSRSTTGEK